MSTRPLRGTLSVMSRSSGIVIVADSTIDDIQVPQPTEPTTEQNVGAQLDALLKALPQGTSWAVTYLPVFGRTQPDGDTVADYLLHEARLYGDPHAAAGTTSAIPAADTMNIMGQRLTREKAQPVIAALGLKPVYLVTNSALCAAALARTIASVHDQVDHGATLFVNIAPLPPGWQTPPPPSGPLRSIAQIVGDMSRTTGEIVLADSTAATQVAPELTEPTTADNLSLQLDATVHFLSDSYTWAKVYLPVPSGRPLNADTTAAYLLDQARLFGGVGAAVPSGHVQIMGRNVPQQQAASVIASLNLKPVYLVMNPIARMAWTSIDARRTDLANTVRWSKMTGRGSLPISVPDPVVIQGNSGIGR